LNRKAFTALKDDVGILWRGTILTFFFIILSRAGKKADCSTAIGIVIVRALFVIVFAVAASYTCG